MKTLSLIITLLFVLNANILLASEAPNSTSREMAAKMAIVDAVFERIGFSENPSTDPEVFKKLLKETHLENFHPTTAGVDAIFQEARERPQDLREIVRMMKHGLANNPAMVDFIKKGLDEGWFANNDYFTKAAHMIFLYENLTMAATNNNEFLKELQGHYRTELNKRGINLKNVTNSFLQMAYRFGNLFEPAKALSVDPGITCYCIDRDNHGKSLPPERVKELYNNGEISFLEKAVMAEAKPSDPNMINPAVQINILEAAVTGYDKGFKDNAFAAYALKEGCKQCDPQKICYRAGAVEPQSYSGVCQVPAGTTNYYSGNDFSPEWVNLYESWNAAFVVSELPDLAMILPKLFIPSQVDCQPQQYLFARAITLWNTVNFVLLKELDKESVEPRPAQYAKIAQEWGKINKQHALDYVKNVLKRDPVEFEKEFDRTFGASYSRYWSLLKLIHNYVQ